MSIYLCDLEKNLLYLNPAAEKLTGWSLQDALWKSEETLEAILAASTLFAIWPIIYVLPVWMTWGSSRPCLNIVRTFLKTTD